MAFRYAMATAWFWQLYMPNMHRIRWGQKEEQVEEPPSRPSSWMQASPAVDILGMDEDEGEDGRDELDDGGNKDEDPLFERSREERQARARRHRLKYGVNLKR